MATDKQEQIYNEIIEYYSYANRMIRAVEDGTHELCEQEFLIVEEIISHLEDYADKLASTYIEFVKSGRLDETTQIIRTTLNEITATIEQCRNRVLMLHHRK